MGNGVRNVSVSENCAYVLNGRSLLSYLSFYALLVWVVRAMYETSRHLFLINYSFYQEPRDILMSALPESNVHSTLKVSYLPTRLLL